MIKLVEPLVTTATTGPRPRRTSTGWVDDAHLDVLLSRAADGDVAAFMRFYDATCDLVWRLELRRHRDRRVAERAAQQRFVTAWQRAAERSRSSLSARAWLLGLRSAGNAEHEEAR